jgi:redox-sensing transcriptional repressor
VPSPFAQATSEILVRAGITSIWNFTNTKLKVPDQIVVQREDLSSGYALLSVQMLAKKSLGV